MRTRHAVSVAEGSGNAFASADAGSSGGREIDVMTIFTGIGVVDIEVEKNSRTRVVCQVENDPEVIKVLEEHFPGILRYGDIAELSEIPLSSFPGGRSDVMVAGFPCIDVSQVGNRGQLDGEYNVLVKHLFRLLEATIADGSLVDTVILENDQTKKCQR